MVFELGVGLAAGLALGWFVRAAKHGSSARLVEELYSRKLKLAESDRDQAVRTLNDNRREMATVDERFAAVDGEIERLLHELEAKLGALMTAEAELEQRATELASLREELERARAFADEALRECAEAARERDEAAGTSQAALVELERRVVEVGELSTRLRERDDECAWVRRELTTSAEQLARSVDEHRATAGALESTREELERARLEGARVQSLELALALASADVADRQRRVIELEAESATLRARVGELEPVVEQRRSLELALAAFQQDRTNAEREHERAWAQRHDEALAAKQREIEELTRHLEEARDAGGALERRLSAVESERTAFVVRIAAQESEIAECRRARAEVAGELEQAEKRAAGLERASERFEEKYRGLTERVATHERELADARRAQGELEAHLATLGASHRAKQLELDRRAVRIAELERARNDRDERIRSLLAEARARDVDRRARETAIKRDSVRSGNGEPHKRDDLQTIAGIGPVLEKKLRQLGITTFRQLAALSRDELERVAAKLGLSVERIRREGWVAAAREEVRAKRA